MGNNKDVDEESGISIRLTALGQYFGQLFTTPLGSHFALIRSPDSFLKEVVELDDVTLRHSVEKCYVDILWREGRLYRLFTTAREDGTYTLRSHVFSSVLPNIGGIEDIIEKYETTN